MLKMFSEFAVPFGSAQLDQPQALNDRLRRLFLERELSGARYRNQSATMRLDPNVFESRFDVFDWPDDSVKELKAFCWKNLYRLIGTCNGFDDAYLARLQIAAHGWFHVTRRGGHFGLHNHPMASWSGVYCVDAGQTTECQESGGLLTFSNPFSLATMFMDASVHQMKTPFGFGSREYQLIPGQLVLFPSWVLHQVTPYQGDGQRITVAFNAWFRLMPARGATAGTQASFAS